MDPLSRRVALKIAAAGTTVLGLKDAVAAAEGTAQADDGSVGRLEKTQDRVWLGGEFWANPMEDWRVVDGAAECQNTAGDRNVHLTTHQLTNPAGSFAMSARIERVETTRGDGGAGFRIGVRSDINEHRSNSFAKGGPRAGIVNGALVLGQASKKIEGEANPQSFVLKVSGAPAGKQYKLTLSAEAADTGKSLGSVELMTTPDAILGNVAVVNNFDPGLKRGQGARYRFSEWKASGDAFTIDQQRMFGPILWAMYTLSDSRSDEGFVMKISALTGPLGAKDNHNVELQIEQDSGWKSLGEAQLDSDAWTAVFRIANWNEKAATRYRLVYREHLRDGSQNETSFGGTIRANPAGRPLRLGALTCQNDYAFPYEPVAKNLLRLDPDMLYFSGDQLYENHGGYGLIRDPAEPAILNYLRKFYQHGWAFRDVMRDRPTVCIPDDHDVFQGNIWGEGGAPMIQGTTSSEGGYREPARMVNVVHRTNAGHHPDYFDPAPCKQDISV
ncbi:MAG: twin-arginine translocation pathway signal, partial [Planctomycetales bacterium]|nr:twin-arginine translocation pathway signal [Planctomycetales bacterium]